MNGGYIIELKPKPGKMTNFIFVDIVNHLNYGKTINIQQ